ncbi:MAG: hypothetical protein H0X29_03640 [Parachlamydiaceae bacterium]|nr:hypothetical protein [Parachlamydiaceae bacterium]
MNFNNSITDHNSRPIYDNFIPCENNAIMRMAAKKYGSLEQKRNSHRIPLNQSNIERSLPEKGILYSITSCWGSKDNDSTTNRINKARIKPAVYLAVGTFVLLTNAALLALYSNQ